MAFIDEHRDRFGGVEQRQASPSARQVRDAELKTLVQEVYNANYRVQGF